MTKLSVNEKRRLTKEIELSGGISKMPSASFRCGKYRYKRTTTGYRRYLLTRDKPFHGRRRGAIITAKEFVSAWRRRR